MWMNSAWLCSKLPFAQSYFSVSVSHSACCKWLTSLSLCLIVSLSETSVMSWKQLHTNCASPWLCSLPASQSACVFSPIKPHCCIIIAGLRLLSCYFLVTLICNNTCWRARGWGHGKAMVKYLWKKHRLDVYARWMCMRWDGTRMSHFFAIPLASQIATLHIRNDTSQPPTTLNRNERVLKMDGCKDEEKWSEDKGREMLWKQLAEHFRKEAVYDYGN